MRARQGAIVIDGEYIAAADANRLLRSITFLFAAQLHTGGVMRARWLFLAVPLLFLVSCDTPTETLDSSDPTFKKPIPLKQSCYDPDDPHCLPYPPPQDPDPDAPGYFIGGDYTMDHCTSGVDLDYDGFDDNCEYRIASRFKPLLATHPGDDTSGEPYFAVKYLEDLPFATGDGVQVMYMFAYYMDWGDPFGGGGHIGDSEFIVLYIDYDEMSQHWRMTGALYAAHWGETPFDFTYASHQTFEFPDADQGYPRVWVARGKHASYPTERKCNEGGYIEADDCSDNTDDARIDLFADRNVGSGDYPFRNCVYSENPVSYAGIECFWYDPPPPLEYEFCGWNLDRTSCSTGYFSHLSEFGFDVGIE